MIQSEAVNPSQKLKNFLESWDDRRPQRLAYIKEQKRKQRRIKL